jgi:hypothetical protein
MNTFTQSKHAILILDGYMIALMHDVNSFYLFDPHARNSFGMCDPSGTAVVFKFGNLDEFLEQYLCTLSSNLNTCSFEIVPVELRAISVECNQISKTVSRVKNARQCVGQNIQRKILQSVKSKKQE